MAVGLYPQFPLWMKFLITAVMASVWVAFGYEVGLASQKAESAIEIEHLTRTRAELTRELDGAQEALALYAQQCGPSQQR